MAAMSGLSGTATLTPPGSSHGGTNAWKFSSPPYHEKDPMQHKPFTSLGSNSPSKAGFSSHNDARNGGRTASLSDHKRPLADVSSPDLDDDDSKWIHRDKLAKIESEELQAAGIVLPKPRSRSRPRRERSSDRVNGSNRRGTDASEQALHPRSRKNSEMSAERTPDPEAPAWDLRLPEEIAEDPGEYFVSKETVKGSRIPVAKQSPAPISADYIERDAPAPRKPSLSLHDEGASISIPKPRSRGGSFNALDDPTMQPGKRPANDTSPKKVGSTRKASAPLQLMGSDRPKTRSGGARSTSATRPTTRSGEISPRAPEGDPPWMISAYKPDPRLPPDQQLLPTVARRLQQEKWEQEGKFGSVYDKEFRPLNDEAPSKPPDPEKPQVFEERQDEWPLRPDARSPSLSRPDLSRPGTSSYSTMPRIQDKPMISPRPIQTSQTVTQPGHMIPEPPESPKDKPKKSGCGCCVIM